MMRVYFVTIALFALALSLASASDPDPVQDFCVALDDPKSAGTYTLFFYFMFIHYCRYFNNIL